MQLISREQITKRLQSLPETLQDAYFSEKAADAIGKTCQLRDINEDLMSIIAKLTGRVLIGYLRPESFAAEIQKETGVSEMTAQLVAHDIDGEIFSNVRLELKKLYPPVIQTPTVQSWKQESQKTNEPAAKPKYIIPIPEKFRGQDLRFKNQDLKIEEPVIQKQTQQTEIKIQPTTQKTETQSQRVNVISPTPSSETNPQAASVTPSLKANEVNVANEVVFKPIVPLPTFIRSQFKMEEPKKAASAENQKTEAKDFVGKFGAPDPTLAKPEASKTDPYKEQIQ